MYSDIPFCLLHGVYFTFLDYLRHACQSFSEIGEFGYLVLLLYYFPGAMCALLQYTLPLHYICCIPNDTSGSPNYLKLRSGILSLLPTLA